MVQRRGSGPNQSKSSKSPGKGARSASGGSGGTGHTSNRGKSSSEHHKGKSTAPEPRPSKGPKATFPHYRPKKTKKPELDIEGLDGQEDQEKGYQHPIQWYPGHVAKWDRALQERLKMVDVVILVLDARLPYTTFDPELLKRLSHKPVLCLLNKRGLSDGQRLPQWMSAIERDLQCQVMTYDAMEKPPREQVVRQLVALGKPVIQKWVDKGLKARAVRVMIVGMPNVGKSTLLNSIVGRKKAQTGHKPGVTRDIQWVRIHTEVELMDSPGIIPPKLSHETVGFLLATISAVSDAVYSEESVAQFLIDTVERIYPGRLAMHYGLADGLKVDLETIGSARTLVAKGGDVDVIRAAKLVLLDFRQGRWGGLLLEDSPSQGIH